MSIKNPYLIDGYTGMKSISWILASHTKMFIIDNNNVLTLSMGPNNNEFVEVDPSNTNITCEWKI